MSSFASSQSIVPVVVMFNMSSMTEAINHPNWPPRDEEEEEDEEIKEYLDVHEIPSIFKCPPKIYVRSCYRELYEIIANSMADGEFNNGTATFTGVPGIGKSLFLVYFIHRFMNDSRFPNKTFAFMTEENSYSLFTPTSEPKQFVFREVKAEDSDFAKVNDILLLCNIKRVDTSWVFQERIVPVTLRPKPKIHAKWNIVITSPCTSSNNQQIWDIQPIRNFIMPTWKVDELEAVNADINSWSSKYNKFGGIPRYVFSEDRAGQRSLAICTFLGNNLHNVIGKLFTPAEFGTVDNTYLVVHMNPEGTQRGDINYEGVPEYTFASQYAVGLFLKFVPAAQRCICYFNSPPGPGIQSSAVTEQLWKHLVMFGTGYDLTQ